MNPRMLSGPVPWRQRLVAGVVAVIGVLTAAVLLVFSFVVGAAVIGGAALLALAAYVRVRFGKPLIPRRASVHAGNVRNPGATIIDAEYEVVRRGP